APGALGRAGRGRGVARRLGAAGNRLPRAHANFSRRQSIVAGDAGAVAGDQQWPRLLFGGALEPVAPLVSRDHHGPARWFVLAYLAEHPANELSQPAGTAPMAGKHSSRVAANIHGASAPARVAMQLCRARRTIDDHRYLFDPPAKELARLVGNG